jgi:CelD/BcsL family acetyltransferase involved in cellulose biosynthesis
MQVDVVHELPALHRLEGAWRQVYAADPESQFFLSWPWLSKRLERRPGWFVLVARPVAAADPVGLFPLKLGKRVGEDGRPFDEIGMAGRGAADYTGFLCVPEYEAEVASAFAAHLCRLRWHELQLSCLRASERRSSCLLTGFPEARFETEHLPMPPSSGIDNAICPYADLPGDWEVYLAGRSPNTRHKLRRLLRALDGASLRVTDADTGTVERDLGFLLRLWGERWAEKKGRRLSRLLESAREELSDASATGSLFLPVLWRDQTPVAAIACLMDFEKREMLFRFAAREPAAGDASPGLLLHAHAIRSAIERGFVRYDFLRGNERYKYSFATGERRIQSIVVRNRALGRRSPLLGPIAVLR